MLSKIVRNVTSKSVAIIGGAELGSDLRTIHDEYDLNVWTNNHWLRYGGPIDGLFHCCGPRAPAEKLLEKLGNEYMELLVGPAWGSGARKFAEYCVESGTPGFFLDQGIESFAYYRGLQLKVQSLGGNTPLTGLVAATFFHWMPVTKIGLFGMDLYQQTESNPMIESHNMPAHAELFYELISTDPRFVACDSLTASIQALRASAASKP